LPIVALASLGCGIRSCTSGTHDSNVNTNVNNPPSTAPPNQTVLPSPQPATPAPTQIAVPPQPEVRHFNGVGLVTKIVTDPKYGNEPSVELNHDEIEGLMPAMIMEFYVKDKALLNNLTIGDKVEFTIEEKGGSEIISAIKKK
jgi:Cu/Ag efflux protein CusF